MPPLSIHPSAIVDEGRRSATEPGCGTLHVMRGAPIGTDCSLGQNVFVANKVVIGNNVKVQNNVSVYDNVTLEDDVFCGPSMVFTNVYNPRSACRARTNTARRWSSVAHAGRQLHDRLWSDDWRIRIRCRRCRGQPQRAALCPDGGRAGPANRLDEPIRRATAVADARRGEANCPHTGDRYLLRHGVLHLETRAD